MAPRKRRTTSATRGKNKGKGASKVTGKTPQSRANRQKASNARVTRSGQGSGRGARVTNASQRTSTGRARVTGGSRPALPPGRKGGSIVKSNARRTAAQNKAGRAAAGTKGTRTITPPNKGPSPKTMNRAAQRALNQVQLQKRGLAKRSLLAALAAGLTVGQWMRKNLKQYNSTSGRGAGRASFNPPKKTGDKPKPKADPKAVAKLTKPGGLFYRGPKPGSTKTGSKPSGGGGSSSSSSRRAAAPAGAPKPKPKKLTDKQRMVGKSSAERLAVWAKANRKMIEKSGTKKQREILANALKKKK